jgi:hypothetical protein
MAMADYWACDVCGAKAFYDAGLAYWDKNLRRIDSKQMPDGAGDMAAICSKCAQTHEVVWRKKIV